MTKNNVLLIAVVVALAAAYVIWFTDWFKPATVQIFHVSRNVARRAQSSEALPGLIFGLNRPLKITEIKLVPLDEFQTNRNILPLWHLVSDSNSVPLKAFTYGANIRGLHPAVKGTRPQALATNTVYRLLVTAGNIKGQHDFSLDGQ
jgi:hypothetical protein